MGQNYLNLSSIEQTQDWVSIFSNLLQHTVCESEFKNLFKKPKESTQSELTLGRTESMIRLIKNQEGLSFKYFKDYIDQELRVNSLDKQIEKSSFLAIDEINQIILILEYLLYLYDNELLNFDYSSQEHFRKNIKFCERMIKNSRMFILPSGEVDYSQHPLIRAYYYPHLGPAPTAPSHHISDY